MTYRWTMKDNVVTAYSQDGRRFESARDRRGRGLNTLDVDELLQIQLISQTPQDFIRRVDERSEVPNANHGASAGGDPDGDGVAPMQDDYVPVPGQKRKRGRPPRRALRDQDHA